MSKYGEGSVKNLDTEKSKYDEKLRDIAFFKAVKLKKGMKVLDVGAGVGDWCIKYAKLGCDVTGIDIVDSLSKMARDKANKYALNIQFKTSSIEDHDAPAEHYDLITGICVFQHITGERELKRSISNISRMTKRNGRVAILEYAPRKLSGREPYSDYMEIRTRAEWIKIFEGSGFKLVGERGVRVLGFKLYNSFKNKPIWSISLLIDRILCSLRFISNRYSDSRLFIFKKV